MIVDTSALLAVLFDESDAALYARAMVEADVCRISAASFVEAAIVVEAQTKSGGPRQFDALMRSLALTIEPVTAEQAHLARQAFVDFGKGRHRAGLNFGDCFSYALAKSSGEALLFKGADFKRTDVESAL
jgi:ribonuclease VapC